MFITSAVDGVGGQRHAPAHYLIPIAQKDEWASEQVWTVGENLASTEVRTPDHPAPSKSWYRLHYTGRHISILQNAPPPAGAPAPSGPGTPPYRGFTITLRHTTLGRTPSDKRSAPRRDIYLKTHNTHKRQTSMHKAGFEPTLPASKQTAADPRLNPRGHHDRHKMLGRVIEG
jgi:hypothetical protein